MTTTREIRTAIERPNVQSSQVRLAARRERLEQEQADAMREFGTIGYDAYCAWILFHEPLEIRAAS